MSRLKQGKPRALAGLRLFTTSGSFASRHRRALFKWLDGPGSVYRHAAAGTPNYLDANNNRGRHLTPKKGNPEKAETGLGSTQTLIPFPANPFFRSQPVLCDELKEVVFSRIVDQGESIRRVSSSLGVEMKRVAAVVRLKTIERLWEEQGRRLATPYARAILNMLPQTALQNPVTPHESINDLPVHKATFPQIFYPVSEGRHFTRVDSGKAFEYRFLPSDERIPHPELVSIEKGRLAAMPSDKHRSLVWAAAEAKDREWAAGQGRKELTVKNVRSGRWNYKLRDTLVHKETTGRHVQGTGTRYGVPPQDRKKGQVKIPTKAD